MSDRERWRTALDGIAHLTRQARDALAELAQARDEAQEDRAAWRDWIDQHALWSRELAELRDCEQDARAALRALTEQPKQAA